MGFLTALIYVVLSLVVGMLLVVLSLNLITLDTALSYLKNMPLDFASRAALSSIGVILILLCFRYIQALFRHSRKNKTITFESKQGKVSITLLAIEDMLKKMLEEKAEVSHMKPKVSLKKKAIEVVATGILTAEVNLVEFTKELQEKIKEKINTLLGEDKPVHINLEIRKVALGGKKSIVQEKEPQIPFRNYE